MVGLVVAVALAGVLLAGGRAQAAAQGTRTVSSLAAVAGPHAALASAGSAPGGIQVGPTLPTTPASTGSPSSSTATAGTPSCGFLDVSCDITSAIDGWFKDLATSALNPVLGLLGRSVLATPEVTGGREGELWAASAGIANMLVVLLVLAGGAVVMGYESVQTRYGMKEVAPRIVLAVIAANASLSLCGLAIGATNSLSQAFLGQGVDPANATSALQRLVTGPLADGGIALVLIALVVAVLAVVLLATYVIRVAVTVLLIVVAPLALICHALPQTEGLARLWWRAFAGVLCVQLAQSLVLVTALRVFLASGGPFGLTASGGLIDLLVGACLLWVMIRIPAWVSRAVFSGLGHQPSAGARLVKTAIVYKVIRAGMAAL
ncbi:MAG: hypothetical protein ACRDZR_11300 [Acidimicrobiales bacterium]